MPGRLPGETRLASAPGARSNPQAAGVSVCALIGGQLREPGRLGGRLRAVSVGAASVSEGRKPRSRPPRGGATLLVLVAAASVAGVVSVTGDGPVSAFYCENLVTTVRTNKFSYAPGQTVIIRVTLANEGPTCSIPPPSACGPFPAGAIAYNSAGKDVWGSGAGDGQTTCPYPPVTSVTYPMGYSSTQDVDWRQDKCFLQLRPLQILRCPRTQVPAGTYRIVGSNGTSGQASATITISGQTSVRRARHRSPGSAARQRPTRS